MREFRVGSKNHSLTANQRNSLTQVWQPGNLIKGHCIWQSRENNATMGAPEEL